MFDSSRTPRMQTRAAMLKARKDAKNIESNSEQLEETRKSLEKISRPKTDAGTMSSHSSSSTLARKKQLEWEAARAKADIEKQLIEKKLAADIAALENESARSNRSHRSSVNPNTKIEQWLDRSNLDAPGLSHCGGQPTEAPVVAAPTDIQQLACAIKDAIVTTGVDTSNRHFLSRLSTSKDLPHYYGDPLEWLQFHKSYQESTELCNYTDTENLWRLRKSLHGEAKDAVSSMLIGNTSPDVIIKTLALEFGRPELIITKIVMRLKKIPPLPPAYHNEIVSFTTKVRNYVAAVQALQQSDHLRSPELMTIVISKCPSVLITKWVDYSFSHSYENKSKLELFVEFLHIEATKTANAGVSNIYYNHSDHKKKHDIEYKKLNKHYNVHTTVEQVMTASTPVNVCKFCNKNKHSLDECTRYKRAMRRDRWNFVKINKLCYKCLAAGHNSETCKAENCNVDGCRQPHHKLLHYVRSSPPDQKKEDDPVETVAHTYAQLKPKVLLKVVPITVHGPKQSVKTYALLDDAATISLISTDVADSAGLQGRTTTMRVDSAWDAGRLTCSVENVKCSVSNSDGVSFDLNAYKMHELDLPVHSMYGLNLDKYKHVRDNDCIPRYSSDIKPKLLIGQDNYHLIAPLECYGSKNEPYVTKTQLGWCVHGVVHGKCDINNSVCSLLHNNIKCNPSGLSACEGLYKSASTSVCARDSSTRECGPVCASLSPLVATATAQEQRSVKELNYCTYNDILFQDEMKRFFSLETMGISHTPRQNANELKAISILDSSAKLINGQWEVGLPWKSETSMPDSYPNAFNRLKSVERKMSLNYEYAVRYKDRVNHLFVNDYAQELVPNSTASRVWYLPHFGVDNPNKNKLRLVFDAAATCRGRALNDYLLQGPDLLQSLLGIMMRFRENPIAVTGDIRDMFLRIKIKPEDRHALRFLWRDNPSDPIKEYVMTSLIFGANCSPFVAQYIKNKNAIRFESTMPEAVKTITESHYMDDCIESFEDVSTAIKVINDVICIHASGGFYIHNWISNCEEVVKNIPKNVLSDKAVRFKIENQPERTLGLMWHPSSDTLSFDVSLKRISDDILNLTRRPTKREVLSIIMSIFDIHGMLAPFTIKAKILMQLIWKSDIKWDDNITDHLYNLFCDWLTQLKTIENIRVPRWYFRTTTESSISCDSECNSATACCSDATLAADNLPSPPAPLVSSDSSFHLELHIFCDASPAAYAAVAYIRKVSREGTILMSFVASKSRVAPVKPCSVPRLELQAAVLGCRLAEIIQREHRFKINKRYLWTDSSTVLHWIRNNTRNYKTFVANRLGEIDSLSKVSEWHYVPTRLNIADVATKQNNYVLNNECEWFIGPRFLYSPCEEWPSEPETLHENHESDVECVHAVYNVYEKMDLPVPDPSRFSKWLRLLRSTAVMLLFIEKCKKNTVPEHEGIDRRLLNRAEVLLLRYSQAKCFQSEIINIKENREINKNSRLRTLTPFIDKEGLLRVDGRISAVKNIDTQIKNPIILDGRDHVARLIVKYYHERTAHSWNEMVVNEVRQKYWIINLRPTVRTVASRCLVCRIKKITPKPSRLGDLPEARLAHHLRPFTHCGIDLFGPFEITVGRQRPKRYGVIFTCMTVRAIHIEVVPSLTTDSLIMALRRAAARRGWPQCIYSDNGTNLRGADAELKRTCAEMMNEETMQSELAHKGVDWHFIPPASPHMGGAWERLIRSVKTTLRVVLKERAPREEVLLTLLAEVENMVNSRPLTHVSVDPRSQETLTPNHFLLGSSSNLPVIGVFDDSDLYLRRQWRIAQRLSDMFWQRWLKEVLPVLLPRQKWYREEESIRVGDLILVVDPNSPRNSWPVGIVETVYPGKDGRVRVVDVKTNRGVLKRPVTRVAPFPRVDECRGTDTGAEDVDDAPRTPQTYE